VNVSKRVLSLVLAVVMMASLFSVSAAAASKTSVKRYSSYTALGDSIPGGYSTPGYVKRGKLVAAKIRFEGAYPSIIADWVQADKAYILGMPGFRTSELRILFDDSWSGDEIDTSGYYKMLSGVDYGVDDLKAQRSEFRNAVKNSSLVTVHIGQNDCWVPLMYAMYRFGQFGSNEDIEEGVAEFLSQFGSLGEMMQTVYDLLAFAVKSPVFVLYMTEAEVQLHTDFVKNYKAIIDGIYECNPNVTVVSVGNYNPEKDWEIPEGSGIELLRYLFADLYLIMNGYAKSLESSYSNYYYVDTSDTEVRTQSLSEYNAAGGWKTMGFDPHPTMEGHKYIANQIISALPKGSRKTNWSRNYADMPTFSKGSKGWGTYLEDGTFNNTYTGLAKTKSGKIYYVKNGKWKQSFSGKVYTSKKTYTVKNGKV